MLRHRSSSRGDTRLSLPPCLLPILAMRPPPQYLKRGRGAAESQLHPPPCTPEQFPHPQRRRHRALTGARDANCTCAMRGPPKNPPPEGGGRPSGRPRRQEPCLEGRFKPPITHHRRCTSRQVEKQLSRSHDKAGGRQRGFFFLIAVSRSVAIQLPGFGS